MKKLADSEFEIMKILWRQDKPLTSNQILKEIEAFHQWKLASLMTVLARMSEKGFVHCDRSTRTNFYSFLIPEEQYKLAESETFLEKLYDRSAKNFIASLCQGKKMTKKDIQALRKYLDSLEENSK